MVSDEYAAGFFDGEGSVYANIRKNGRSPTLLICISNTNRDVLDAHLNRWGGSIAERKITKENHQRQFQWVLSSVPARSFLKSVLPHLIIKRDVAEVALDYLRFTQDTPREKRLDYSHTVTRHGRKWARPKTRPEFRQKAEDFYWQIRKLNQRGAPFNVTRQAFGGDA